MSGRLDRKRPVLVVVDRGDLADELQASLQAAELDAVLMRFGSVLEVVGENGPSDVAGLVASVASAGPFLQDLLRWTDRDHITRVAAAVIGTDADRAAINVVLGRDHVQWVEASRRTEQLLTWARAALEVYDLRAFRARHDALATSLREARSRLFLGEGTGFVPPEGPPCGPPLPTSMEEIQPLRDALAQFERGLIRAAVREFGSLKDASAALGISYTSLWRRLR